MIYLIGYLTALATFIVLDVAWLSVTIPRFYRTALGEWRCLVRASPCSGILAHDPAEPGASVGLGAEPDP